MKIAIYLLLFLTISRSVVFAALGTLPEFRSLADSGTVILFDSDQKTATPDLQKRPAQLISVENPSVIVGKSLKSCSYSSNEVFLVNSAKTLMVFLKENEAGVFELVNPLLSSIPSSVKKRNLRISADSTFMDLLVEMFILEENPIFSLIQARIIIGADKIYAEQSWQAVAAKVHNQAGGMLLSSLVVGLHAKGSVIFDMLDEKQLNISSSGIESGEDAAWHQQAKGSIVTWFRKNKSTADIDNMLKFVFAQSPSEFQADLILTLSKEISSSHMNNLLTILLSSDIILLKYAAFKAIMNIADRSGIPTLEDFSKNPGPFLEIAKEIAGSLNLNEK